MKYKVIRIHNRNEYDKMELFQGSLKECETYIAKHFSNLDSLGYRLTLSN